MFLVHLFKEKLIKDLKKELSISNPELSDDKIMMIIERKLDSMDLEENIRNRLPTMIKSERDDMNELCCARVWSSHYGNRCSKMKMNGKDYCCQHQDMYDKYGYLSLGRYDETRPLVNEKGNLIPWYNYEILDMLNILTEYIFLKLFKE